MSVLRVEVILFTKTGPNGKKMSVYMVRDKIFWQYAYYGAGNDD